MKLSLHISAHTYTDRPSRYTPELRMNAQHKYTVSTSIGVSIHVYSETKPRWNPLPATEHTFHDPQYTHTNSDNR